MATQESLKSDIREFRQVKGELTKEQKEAAEHLSRFKGARFKDRSEYVDYFQDKIFKYKKKYYTYRFKFGIRKRYIGEEMIILGILEMIGTNKITELSASVRNPPKGHFSHFS